jgi:hypothetical protein
MVDIPENMMEECIVRNLVTEKSITQLSCECNPVSKLYACSSD